MPSSEVSLRPQQGQPHWDGGRNTKGINQPRRLGGAGGQRLPGLPSGGPGKRPLTSAQLFLSLDRTCLLPSQKARLSGCPQPSGSLGKAAQLLSVTAFIVGSITI